MDLLSPHPFWPARDGLPATFPPLEKNVSCDVAIIGGGISGACIAWHLAAAGIDTLLVERRDVAHGSTAGNTGLLLYELDVPLCRLARRIGLERAQRAYRRCRAAVDAGSKLARRVGIDCGLERRASLYVAATRTDVPWLRREFAARQAAGLEVDWWSRGRLAAESSLPHAAAIRSRDAAQFDPYRLTYGLLLAAQRLGARIHDRTAVTRRTPTRSGVDLFTSRGARIRARHVVLAIGYEAGSWLPAYGGLLRSTFALVTEPLAGFDGWPAARAMIWDTGDPYCYARTTEDGRAIIGGYDENFRDPRARDRLLGRKVVALKRKFAHFFPRIPFEVANAWAGTFGESTDGLPFIGQHPHAPHTWFALCFGGNGTTFSVIAAEIIRAGIRGETDPDAALFGFDR